MNALHKKLKDSPLLARILPFLIFIVLTSSQGSFGPESHYWIYLIKTLIGIWMIWITWPLVGEMRLNISLEALGGGILVFVLSRLSYAITCQHPAHSTTVLSSWQPSTEIGPTILETNIPPKIQSQFRAAIPWY